MGGEGADCARSTECAAGLVCIEGACSSDLSSIADPGEVPELMPEAGMEPTPDAAQPGPDAGEVTPDAGEMTPDAETMAPDAETMLPVDAALPLPPVDGG